MSIEAIKEALKAGPTSALFTHPRDDNKWKENEAFALACEPAAIRELIERLEAAEKDAERYRWLRDSHPADGEVWAAMGIPNTPAGISCWRHEELDAAIDSAMAGGLAEGVSDVR